MLGWLGRRVAATGTGQASAEGGGVSNTGVIHGDVHVYPLPAARSAYLEQVRRIAPESLKDRDRELDELAGFCTAPEQGPYMWLRAKAWAGKSALMSWFVLHPPTGVRVVSFFVTARYAGQSDRIAFTDVVIEQLANLLGEPIPGHLTEATRDPHFLALLGEAAKACQQAGERLVLVVDGLDEDRGVIAGPDAYSIAAVLPADPPAGMRVIVAGRPNPPIPADVPRTHPLRNPDVIRALNKSRHAEVVRTDSERELKRLLHGTRTEQDLLGLVTAAGGGLSGRDLAELTGLPAWEIEEHLHAVSGRTFNRRTSRWQPDLAPEVYVLGHEELQVTAIRFLGEARLNDYRQRLHVWADQYRERAWPASTPEYLLRGYYRMLHATGDLSRMIACGTDRIRHDRMLDITGGDTAALAEVTTAQDAILAQDDPNLAEMARLAVHRDSLSERNSYIPIRLPAVWANLGHITRAEALANSMTDLDDRIYALIYMMDHFGDSGNREYLQTLRQRAEMLAETITDPNSRGWVLDSLVGSLIRAGDHDRAEALAHTITSVSCRISALDELARYFVTIDNQDHARALAKQAEGLTQTITDPSSRVDGLLSLIRLRDHIGDREHARALAKQAEKLTYAITDPRQREYSLTWLACAVTDIDYEYGAALANDITDPEQKVEALSYFVKHLSHGGHHQHAQTLTQQAEKLIQRITEPEKRARAVFWLVHALVKNGDHKHAEAIARTITDPDRQGHALDVIFSSLADIGMHERAEAIAHSITSARWRASTLADLAAYSVDLGDHQNAHALAQQAEKLTRTIVNPQQQVSALHLILESLNRIGHHEHTRTLAQQAEKLIQTISDPYSQVSALRCQVTLLVDMGDKVKARTLAQQAEKLTHTIADPEQRSWALSLLVSTLTEIGDHQHARTLAQQTIKLTHTTTNPEKQAQALYWLVHPLTEIGDHQHARTLIQEAEKLTHTIADPEDQISLLSLLVSTLTEIGDHEHARTLAQETIKLIHTTTNPDKQARALYWLVRPLTKIGDHEHALALAQETIKLTRTTTNPDKQARALYWLVRSLAEIGDHEHARALIQKIERLSHNISDQAELPSDLVESLKHIDYDHAEAFVYSITEPQEQAEALIAIAEDAEPNRSKSLVALALRRGPWTVSISLLAQLEPCAVLALVDTFLDINDGM